MHKKALITGITGHDDTYLAEFFLKKGHEPHARKRRPSSFNTDRRDHLYQDANSSTLLVPSTMNLAPLINIGCGKDLIICELAELVREVIGFTENLTFDSTKPDEPMQKLLSANKLKQLGWKATTSLREGITSAYKTDLMQSS